MLRYAGRRKAAAAVLAAPATAGGPGAAGRTACRRPWPPRPASMRQGTHRGTASPACRPGLTLH